MAWLRLAIALAACVAAGYGGWRWHRPAGPLLQPAASSDGLPPDAGRLAAPPVAAIVARLKAADVLGLNRAAAAGTPAAAATATAADPSRNWRVAALVVRDKDSYAVLTSEGQETLVVHAGEALPDGDRVVAVKAGRIEIKSPRGRLRTLYLIEQSP